MKNLRDHLLPRVYSKLNIAAKNLESQISDSAQNLVVIKDHRIYNHKLARFYYTTYDVRRSEDIINPKTSHCNIMLLSNLQPSSEGSSGALTSHPFLYGRVVGIYHANVVYIGPGMKDYTPIRFDFLHVRWLQLEDTQHQIRHNSKSGLSQAFDHLERLSFPPMAGKDSFGFVDPCLVLRSCHLIPAFSFGKRYSDGIGISSMARDSGDWRYYYVNRSVMFLYSQISFAQIISGLLIAI